MATNTIRCACGWMFFVPEQRQGIVPCPSCGMKIVVPSGPTRGILSAPVTPTLPAELRKPKWTLPLLLASGAALCVLMVVLVVVLTRSKPVPAGQTVEVRPSMDPHASAPRSPYAPTERPITKYVLPDAPDYERRIDLLVARKNMAGLVATILLHTGRQGDHHDLQGRIREYDKELVDIIDKGAKRGEKLAVPVHYESYDRIVSFGGSPLEPGTPADFVEVLKRWMRTFHAGIKTPCAVKRGGEGGATVMFTMYFTERPKELLTLANFVDIMLGESNAPPATTQAPASTPAVSVPPVAIAGIPAELTAEIEGMLSTLHPYYRNAFPAGDVERARKLLAAGKGTVEEVDFLRARLLPLCHRFAEEHASFKAKLAELEVKTLKQAVAVDVVIFKDGRRIEGKVEQETDEFVKIVSRLGSVRVPRSDVERIERGKGAASDFPAKYTAAKGDVAALQGLLAECREKKLVEQKELVCFAILSLDPGREGVRAEAGVSPPSSLPIAAAEPDVQRQADKFQWQGRWYTKEELDRQLRSVGYVSMNGIWCEKVVKVYKVDNLFKDFDKLKISGVGAAVVEHQQIVDGKAYDYRTRQFVPKNKIVAVTRYVGTSPTATPSYSGRVYDRAACYIEIEAPGDFYECRIKATAQVTYAGGYVSVSVVNEIGDTAPMSLYTLATVRTNDSSYPVDEKVRGRGRFYIRSEVRGYAMFLPCDSNDLGVLEVRYVYGKPLTRLNAALGLTRQEPPPVPLFQDQHR